MSGAAGLGIEARPGDPPTALPERPLTTAVKSDGCGKAFSGMSGATYTMLTQGQKAADCADKLNDASVCGAWMKRRVYAVWLPEGYDADKAYPLVFEAPDCGQGAKDVYPLERNVGNTVIRVGIAPGPNSTGHATNPGEGCFDEKEGDDSIDWVFYENLYDRLNADLCFDRNRVFSLGKRSGAQLSNELGCKYAGDSLRPIRGVGVNQGALPRDPAYVPTCSMAPVAGLWLHEADDPTWPFSDAKLAIDRAMTLASCSPGSSFDTATFENFPISRALPDDTCRRIEGCDPLYPLVVCLRPGNQQGSNDVQVNSSFSTFVKLFSAGSMLTQ